MMLVGGFTLTSCVDNKDDANEGGSGDNYKNYVERMYPVVDPQNSPQGMVMLRFYDDMPSVAYVSISNFQSIMYPGTTVQVVKTAEHQYALASPCGTAKVDTDKDLFMSNDYEAFTNMMDMVQPGMPNTSYDALPIIRWKSLDASPKQVDVTLDYGKYGIDIREDGENVYFPFATIADLYTDSYMHIADFNGETVMVAPDGAYSLKNGYPSFFITPILKETRTADMADFAYRNLCFTLTNFFGYPGRTLLENKGLKEKGLDQALQDYGKAGQMTRELLQSTNMYDFISGTVTLGCLLNDGGHTNTDVTVMSDFSGNPTFLSTLNGIIDAKWGEFWDICPEYVPIYENLVGRITLANHLNEARAKALGEDVNYYKVGNTAYCQFGTFLCDDSGWRKFYKGEGPKPTIDQYPNDWLVILVDALEKAQNDPEVKNFILDISANGGGSSDIVLFITSLFANKSDLYYENVLTGQKMKSTFEVDRNLDGKFDEKDKDVKLKMNIPGRQIRRERQGCKAEDEHRCAHQHLQLLMWQSAARTPERLRHLPARQEVGRRILRGALQPLSRWLRLYLLHASYSPQQLERREHRRRHRARLPVGSRRIL